MCLLLSHRSKNTEVFLTGKTARQELNSGEKYLVLFDGYRHIGTETSLDWEISKFDRYLIRLNPEIENRPDSLDTQSTEALMASGRRLNLPLHHGVFRCQLCASSCCPGRF